MKSTGRPDKCNQILTLRDGRRLGFAEYGAPDGRPLMYFHGWPSSRFEPQLMDPSCREMGLRLLAPDRPGYGLSDFLPGRSIMDLVADVSELADQLGLERFAVLGMSGGGPYATACGARIAERLTTVLLMCSVGPIDAPGATNGMAGLTRGLLYLARKAPGLAQKLAEPCLRAVWRKGEQALPWQLEKRLCALDKTALANPELRSSLVESAREALRPGVRGAAWEGLLYARPWDFKPDEVRIPVKLWHGEQDVIVPPGMGHYLARSLPKCSARFYSDDGHFSLPFNRIREILASALR